MKGLSRRKFAEAAGCSHTLVGRAVREGRLVALEDGSIDTGQLEAFRKGLDSNARAGQRAGAPPQGVRNWPVDETREEPAPDWFDDPMPVRWTYNVNQLFVELGASDPEDLWKALKEVPIDGYRAGLPAWHMTTALKALGWQRPVENR